MDPRRDGCRMNQKAWESGEEVVQLVELAGQEQLFFPAFPLDACIIKGSTADADGNISMEKEAFLLEQYRDGRCRPQRGGGLVLAQVDQLVPAHTMNAKDVVVPGCLVDYIVVGREKTPGSSLSPRSAGWRPLPGGCASRWRGCRRCRRTSKR